MKHIKIVLGLAVALGAFAVAAAPALAASHAWFECVKKTGGAFKNSLCSEAGPPNEFELVEVATAIASVSEGELKLTDSKTIVGEEKIRCKIVSEGKIGPKAEDKIESATLSGCVVEKGACSSPTAVAVHLPWNTELEEVGGEIRDQLKSSGAGLPGYEVTCSFFGKQHDTCEGETSAKIANNLSAGLVEATFESKSKKAKCTQSKGAETGTVEGTLKIKAKSGVGISVK